MLCLCIGTFAFSQASPSNDNPSDAIVLTVGLDSCSDNTAAIGGNLTEATNSNVGGTPSCGYGLGSDVWYTAVVPDSGNLAIETYNVDGNYFNSVLTAYTKDSSDTYTEVGCDENGGEGVLSKLVLTGQTVGSTIYIRVWGSYGERDPFKICVWSPEPLSILENGLETFKVYPNPAKNILHIEAQIPPKQVSVYSLTGAQIMIPVLLAENTSSLDVSVLLTGIYVLQITHDRGSAYIKFVKE